MLMRKNWRCHKITVDYLTTLLDYCNVRITAFNLVVKMWFRFCIFARCFRFFGHWQNPWKIFADPLGFAEAWLKNADVV